MHGVHLSRYIEAHHDLRRRSVTVNRTVTAGGCGPRASVGELSTESIRNSFKVKTKVTCINRGEHPDSVFLNEFSKI